MTTGTATRNDVDSAVRDLIYRSCLRLDAGDFPGWLELCAPDFRYTITAYSPEIRKEMTWLDQDREGMEGLFRMLPKHNSDHSPLTRHASVYVVEREGDEAAAITSVVVYKTALDGGATDLFAVGKYFDTVSLEGESRSSAAGTLGSTPGTSASARTSRSKDTNRPGTAETGGSPVRPNATTSQTGRPGAGGRSPGAAHV